MQLASMGFDIEGCKRAVFHTHNQGMFSVLFECVCVCVCVCVSESILFTIAVICIPAVYNPCLFLPGDKEWSQLCSGCWNTWLIQVCTS